MVFANVFECSAFVDIVSFFRHDLLLVVLMIVTTIFTIMGVIFRPWIIEELHPLLMASGCIVMFSTGIVSYTSKIFKGVFPTRESQRWIHARIMALV